MLVLTRRRGEAIVIGHDVVVRVLEIRNDQVRIGIDAPRSVGVHREEIYTELERANTEAARSAAQLNALRTTLKRPQSGQGGAGPGQSGPGQSGRGRPGAASGR